MSLVVTLIAWIVMALAAANAYVLFSTHGELTAGLPFSGYVEYAPVVVNVITWGGHVAVPAWLSTIGAGGLVVAAFATAGLRRIGGAAGPLLFCSVLLALLGFAGSVIGLVIVTLATAIGVAIVVALVALMAAVCLMLLAVFLAG